jgi:type I restriction enzyme R subunit
MSLHKEIHFEIEICEYLAAHGWLHGADDAAGYDRERALYPEDLLVWIQATQPKAWEGLVKSHGANASATLLNRLRESLDQRLASCRNTVVLPFRGKGARG